MRWVTQEKAEVDTEDVLVHNYPPAPAGNAVFPSIAPPRTTAGDFNDKIGVKDAGSVVNNKQFLELEVVPGIGFMAVGQARQAEYALSIVVYDWVGPGRPTLDPQEPPTLELVFDPAHWVELSVPVIQQISLNENRYTVFLRFALQQLVRTVSLSSPKLKFRIYWLLGDINRSPGTAFSMVYTWYASFSQLTRQLLPAEEEDEPLYQLRWLFQEPTEQDEEAMDFVIVPP